MSGDAVHGTDQFSRHLHMPASRPAFSAFVASKTYSLPPHRAEMVLASRCGLAQPVSTVRSKGQRHHDHHTTHNSHPGCLSHSRQPSDNTDGHHATQMYPKNEAFGPRLTVWKYECEDDTQHNKHAPAEGEMPCCSGS